jgi:hypothetical protein
MMSLLLGDIVVMNVIFKKKIKIKLKAYYFGLFKGIMPCLLITACTGWLFSFLGLSGWLGWLVNVMVMITIYIVCMLLFGLNKYEKSLIFDIFYKIFKRGKKDGAFYK